jgi:hypothetical protein
MKKVIVVLSVLVLLAVTAMPTLAAPPCNDTNGDGSASGMEYAHYHIVSTAHNGDLGKVDHDGDGSAHTPGAHHGFSVCNPSGK